MFYQGATLCIRFFKISTVDDCKITDWLTNKKISRTAESWMWSSAATRMEHELQKKTRPEPCCQSLDALNNCNVIDSFIAGCLQQPPIPVALIQYLEHTGWRIMTCECWAVWSQLRIQVKHLYGLCISLAKCLDENLQLQWVDGVVPTTLM